MMRVRVADSVAGNDVRALASDSSRYQIVDTLERGRIRRPVGGRKRTVEAGQPQDARGHEPPDRDAQFDHLNAAVCHFPPGTSKWNKIEHRLFSAITRNWRGKPLVSHEVIVKLIAATTTRRGPRVKSALDRNAYPNGVSVSDADMATLYLRPDAFHGLMLPQD